LFANPEEENPIPSDPGDPDIIYFGPGIHDRGPDQPVELSSGQTLYLAGGAILKAEVIHAKAADDPEPANITIRGRGMIDGQDWVEQSDAQVKLKGDNIRIEGITIRGSPAQALFLFGCSDALVRNVKVCNGRLSSGGGLLIGSSRRVRVEDSFLRTDDDTAFVIAMKFGNNPTINDHAPEDIVFRRCVFWSDRHYAMRLTWQADDTLTRGITYTDIDVVHFQDPVWPEGNPAAGKVGAILISSGSTARGRKT